MYDKKQALDIPINGMLKACFAVAVRINHMNRFYAFFCAQN